MLKQKEVIGYLPDERPSTWKLLLYAIQQVIVMFPATVAVALITGFQVSTTIFASGLATICFILITRRQIPLYYGSSFSYLTAVAGLMSGQAVRDSISPQALIQLDAWSKGLTSVLPSEAISYAQFGIIMSGFISIGAGLLVRAFGSKAVEKILPASITGPVAMIIGLTLAGVALSDAAPKALAEGAKAGIANGPLIWLVSLATLLSTILFSRYLKGFLGQLPLLLGAAVGCAVAGILYLFGGTDLNLFREIPKEALAGSLWSAGPFAIPAFSLPKVSLAAVIAIMPIAIATIPESTAHIYQLDIYVNDLAKKKKAKKYNLAEKLHLNLIGDGIGDMISGFVGGPAGTNYGENISTMAITRVFSVPVLFAASIIAMVLAFFTPLVQGIYAIPQAVIGGLEIYLFGAIAAQGAAIMIDKKVDMFSPKNIAVIATIMVIGIGGQYAFGGNIPFGVDVPFFGSSIPCIAAAAIFGILLNLILSIGEKKNIQPEQDIAEANPQA
ncbi:MAG: xanthine permease [Clostridiales bacterium 43-6]|nr:MAG: xanthine permease [Clostridiales bacterium 43-6]